MKHWSVDINQLKKHPTQYTVWKLEQQINFGLSKKKINKTQLKKHWPQLNLDPKKKTYLKFLLWG